MTRAERLFRVLNFIENGEDFSISSIAQDLGVSVRTIYRDIKTIRRLSYLREKSSITSIGNIEKELRSIRGLRLISELDLRLINFALTTHPLINVFPFHDISRRLESSLVKMGLVEKLPNQKL